jgi:hypothetical protein
VARDAKACDSCAGAVHANLLATTTDKALRQGQTRLREDSVYIKPTAPRSIGGIVDDGIKLYGSAFAKSWPLSLLAQVLLAGPALILRFQMSGLQISATNPQAIQAMQAIFKSPSVWLSYIVMVIVFIGFYNALLILLDGVAETKAVSFGRSLAAGFRLMPRTILLFVVLGLALAVAVIVVGIVGGILVAVFSRALGSVVSPIAIGVIFGGLSIYVWGRLFLSNIALVVEDTGVFKSLGTSWSLIKNHWWRTATIYTVALIIVIVFYFMIAFVNAALVGVTVQGVFGTRAILAQLVSMAGGTVLMSLVPAVLLTMYYDLKLRKEGTDLAGRVDALAAR